MSLVTLDEIKTYMRITGSEYDDLLTMFQESVEQSIINYCETDFETHVITNEMHDGLGADVIVPKYFPILSVQSIVFGVDAAGAGGSEQDSDNYYYDATGIMLRKGIVTTPRGRGYIRVDYTAGYASIPSDVKMVVYQSVKAEYQRQNRNNEDINSRSKGEESENYGAAWDKKTGLPSQIVSKLQSYRIYEFPLIGSAQRNR